MNLLGCSKYDGMGTATRPWYNLKKIASLASQQRYSRGRQPRILSIRKAYRMGNSCLKLTVQPFSGPFRFVGWFSLYKGSTQWRYTQLEPGVHLCGARREVDPVVPSTEPWEHMIARVHLRRTLLQAQQPGFGLKKGVDPVKGLIYL